MAFKLGRSSSRKSIAEGGNLKSVPVYKKDLDKGVLGEAYSDGTIAVDKSLKEGSQQYKDVVAHEMDHAKRMKSGELGYGNDWVRYKGKTYPRKDGKIKYNGKWKQEGDRTFPWEKIADKAMENKRPSKESDSRATSAAFQNSALTYNGKLTTHKEERKTIKDYSESRKAKFEETKKGYKDLGYKKAKRKYRDLTAPYQPDKKILTIKKQIDELSENAIHAGEVNKKRILNKIERLKAKLPKRAK